METGLNASACVGKQPIMVATASTEHPIGCCSSKRNARNTRNASDCVWMETGLKYMSELSHCTDIQRSCLDVTLSIIVVPHVYGENKVR